MANIIKVRALYRRPLRLGKTRISTTGTGTAIDIEDPVVRRDLYRHLGNWVVMEDAADATALAAISVPDAAASAAAGGLAGSAAGGLAGAATGGVASAAGDPPTQAEFDALVSDHNALQADMAAAEADHNALQADVAAMEADHNSLVADMDAVITKLNDTIQALRDHGLLDV